jgi:hypothetical protein
MKINYPPQKPQKGRDGSDGTKGVDGLSPSIMEIPADAQYPNGAIQITDNITSANYTIQKPSLDTGVSYFVCGGLDITSNISKFLSEIYFPQTIPATKPFIADLTGYGYTTSSLVDCILQIRIKINNQMYGTPLEVRFKDNYLDSYKTQAIYIPKEDIVGNISIMFNVKNSTTGYLSKINSLFLIKR